MPERYTLRIRQSPEGWWATCDEIPGYVLGAESIDALRSEFRFGLRDVLDLGEPVIVEAYDAASAEAVG